MAAPMRGILSGLIATVILSGFMILRLHLNIVPELDIVQIIGKMGGNPPTGAWMTHFVVGGLLWGFLFAGFAAITPGPYVIRGMAFGVIAWLAMMTLFMPAANLGSFASAIGTSAVVVTFIMHQVYGAALGLAYGILGQIFPEREFKIELDAETEVLRQMQAKES